MNQSKLFLLITVACTSSLPSFPAVGQDGIQDVLIHSYHDEDANGQMSLTNRERMGMEKSVQPLFQRIDPSITVKKEASSVFNLLQTNIRSSEYKFEINGIPLCQFQLKSHESIHGSVTVLGKIPSVEVNRDFQLDDWPSVQDSMDLSQNIRFEKGIQDPFTLVSKSPCLWVDQGRLQTAWNMVVTSNRLEYSVIADGSEIYDFQNRFFHAEGTARVYSTNPVDGELIDYPIDNLIPDENGQVLVENDRFITLLDIANYSYFADLEAPYALQTDPAEEAFKEISLFANANRTLDWLESQGYANFGTEEIRIVVHASFGDDNNNALYQPGEDFPTIYVGDGDGVTLQNLALDYDVIAHELGHHVVYHSIKDIQNESLVLHEALADFFTYAKTGNACLGESICPPTSGICAIANQCLRTAENDYAFTSSDLPTQAHLRSQFISGYLWDLVTLDEIPTETLTKIVLQAIDLFVADSGYRHFILGLMIVDESSYDGQYCNAIYNRAIERGLSSKISDYSCSSMSSLVSSSGGSIKVIEDNQTLESTTTAKKKSSSLCGSITLSSNGHLSILFLISAPFILRIRRRNHK